MSYSIQIFAVDVFTYYPRRGLSLSVLGIVVAISVCHMVSQ